MKVRVKAIEEIIYEIDVSPEEYCKVRAELSRANDFHEKILCLGKTWDLSRTWKSIYPATEKDANELNDFLDKNWS